MKFKRFWPLLLLLFVGVVWARSSDIWSLRGRSYLKSTDVIRLTDSATPDIELYNGDLYFKSAETTPSTTAGGYPGVKVRFVNASGKTLVQGNVLVWHSTGTANAKVVSVTSTTTIAGICEGTVAAGEQGYMTVAGYALVLTTGAVTAGNVIVSTNVMGAGTTLGYAGEDASPDSGAVIGRAVTNGTAAGGLTLTLLGL